MALAGGVLGRLASTAVAAGKPASRRLLATAAAAAPGARLAATPPSAAVAAAAAAAAPKKKAGIAGAIRSALGEAASPLPPGYAVDEEFLHETPTHVTTLSNGLRVATERHPVGAATVGVWVDAGSRFETEDTNGAAHFLEHLVFKGTAAMSQRSLETTVENMGANFNAYTSREQTAYFGRAVTAHVPALTSILADILLNSEMSPASVERERDVIIQEYAEVNKLPEEELFDNLHATAFQGTPLAQTILGSEDCIRSLQRPDLRAYVKRHYQPHRMVLVGAGDVDHDTFVTQADKLFGGMRSDPAAESAAQLVAARPCFLTGSDMRVRDDHAPDAHFAIAFESCGWAHPDAVAFMVLESLLGGWDRYATTGDVVSSRLANGLHATPSAKRVGPFNTSYADTGLFGLYAVAAPHDLDDVVSVMMGELVRFYTSVDERALAAAKMALKTRMMAAADGSTAAAEETARQLLVFGRKVPLAEWVARIDAVDAAAVKRLVGKYVWDREVAVSALGNVSGLPDLTWIRRRTYSTLY
ncbi:hypothetical protein I4F81_008250 [Pyropia yezoensis]|uniref:Uncharacterized protein n=1 Tax=Pyropia yezoensis TaxID=2788 RepID=A0ACC3C687_PYRYE|nr:hypothetical protein I4F81_008250 [Neopyropia yezoensis]